MFEVYEMKTHRFKVRKYLTMFGANRRGKAKRIFNSFSDKDKDELVRLYAKAYDMNRLFLPQ
jgi:uncharacterized protein with von Willebrand factor type A (vWA) domain